MYARWAMVQPRKEGEIRIVGTRRHGIFWSTWGLIRTWFSRRRAVSAVQWQWMTRWRNVGSRLLGRTCTNAPRPLVFALAGRGQKGMCWRRSGGLFRLLLLRQEAKNVIKNPALSKCDVTEGLTSLEQTRFAKKKHVYLFLLPSHPDTLNSAVNAGWLRAECM